MPQTVAMHSPYAPSFLRRRATKTSITFESRSASSLYRCSTSWVRDQVTFGRVTVPAFHWSELDETEIEWMGNLLLDVMLDSQAPMPLS